ncbi:pyruvate dehydrogenase complex dihydrolipoamide acetyltransferase [Varunaivibrio sulfuroxidans]|uniref:pyruvate dehydrogenase complex dihydrolipoamide acetyltransferase n=1 Tax=Varunaivibrio sulfuroxidans TaxID=1773489 RepID=UPI0023E11BCC|nr:pyruvate dehydrogenase complex dihydrolipoamide acetyltransferase [Varunaivibrio sulfuroxidans]WES31355.1 pyruvate dehydrogenase complex dihydrolipoamide acetyltransferase [Varunaivibrio sulfuroxidans]
MPIQITMPALSPTMTEGNLAKWLKNEGDAVSSGDVIAEIETDKATMEVEAVDDGVLGKIVVPAGSEGVAVNSVIALLLEEGEDASALENVTVTAPSPAPPPAPAPAPAPTPTPTPAAQAQGSTPASSPTPLPASARSGGDRLFASPLARRMADQAGLDLSALTGSGPHGRIVKRDVEQAIEKGVPAKTAAAQGAPQAMAIGRDGGTTAQPNSTMRKIIAKRLQESKQTVPHFYLTVDCELDGLIEARKRLNALSPEGEGAYKLSVNDFIIKAVALALKRVPTANAMWTDDAIELFNDIDVSVAVATPGGLITPVVRNADLKGMVQISNEIKSLAARGRDGKLMPEEYQGGGFTISNLGMYGVKEFSAIINPPQSCILAVGAGEQRPVVKNGELAIATVMGVTLSVDHRAVDGALGARFLQAFKSIIEEPYTLIL